MLAPLQPVPLRRHRALDVGQERRGVALGALDDVARLGDGRGFGLAGLGQAGRRLVFAPFDGNRALGFAPRVLVEPLQQLGQARRVERAVTLGASDQLGTEAEAGGDGQRVALPGPVVAQAEGGSQRGRVELDGRVARARMRAGEGLQRLQVRRGHDERAALGQRFQNGLGQRGPLIGIGPRAQLVEEDVRRPRPGSPALASRRRRTSRDSRPRSGRHR